MAAAAAAGTATLDGAPLDSPKMLAATPRTPSYKSRFAKQKKSRSNSGRSNSTGGESNEGSKQSSVDAEDANRGSLMGSLFGLGGVAATAPAPAPAAKQSNKKAATTKKSASKDDDLVFDDVYPDGDERNDYEEDANGNLRLSNRSATSSKVDKMDQSDLRRVSFSVFAGQFGNKSVDHTTEDDFDFRRGKLLFILQIVSI